ncbi:MAG: Fe-S cluster assembly protein SufD [Anaerolineaceae bacterium]
MMEAPVVVKKKIGFDKKSNDFSFTRSQLTLDTLPRFMADLKEKSWDIFSRTALPTIKDEAWRRTDLKNLNPGSFRLPEIGEFQKLPGVPNDLLSPIDKDENDGQVIIMPGGTTSRLNPELKNKGVVFTDLGTALKEHPEIVERIIARTVKPEDGKFSALAFALAENGVVLYIPRNVVLEKPLHSILWGPGENLAHLSNLIIWLEEGASVTYIHEAASPNNGSAPTMHAGNVELHIGPAANLRFVELQSWGNNVWNFCHERAVVEKDGNLDWIFGAIGSRLTKNFTDLDLVGAGSTGKMSGFYFTDGRQHLDHDTQQNHLAPHTTSDLLFKGALLGESRSVWQGMIYVAPIAMKTDGYQANRNLILSDRARADSIPGLEILADDVRCTHGATVGKLDQDEVFYLRSRGIPEKEANRLIVEGFFDQIMQRIPIDGVRNRFQRSIHEKMQ